MDNVPDGGVNALKKFSKCCARKGTRHTGEGGSGRGKGGGWGRQGKTQCRGPAPAPALHHQRTRRYPPRRSDRGDYKQRGGGGVLSGLRRGR